MKYFSRLIPVTAGVFFLPLADQLHAHGLQLDDSATSSLSAAAVVTWRSAAAVDDNTAWRLPGFLMGGESWPVDEGVGLDEINVTTRYAIDKNIYAVAKAGIHGSGKGSDHGDSVEIQHAYLGWRSDCTSFCFAAEAGKMSALFSPAMTEHASTRSFSEASLIMDSFFGRDFHDQGARILFQSDWGVSGGVEHWRGQSFPSTPTDNGGNNDVFLRYDVMNEHIVASIGTWVMRADAENRVDHRYSADHTHSSNTAPLFPSVGFTGTTDFYGIHGSLRWNFASDWALSVSGEWVEPEADGFLQNNQRTADLLSEAKGAWIQPAVHWRNHTLAIRAEELQVDNYLEGPGAPALTLDSGLSTQGHNPERISAVWLWDYKRNVTFRFEAIDDRSLPNDASRINIGIIWRQDLWRK
ncbi:MAG: hypothetical protein AAGC78_06805 [Cellvibrio sp.]|uniref:hypothetical protein n=1 Tax=Cellvibrio sp. TaxID=1965322 RepID=UPI0031A2C108